MSRTSSLQISLMNQNHTNNQCTPTFKRLWNRDFTMLVIAEVMLCMSCYMAIPLLPQRLAVSHGISMECASATMIAFVVGICVSGFFSSWLIQRYRRNKVFCISALCLGLTIATMFVLTDRTAGFIMRWKGQCRKIFFYTINALLMAGLHMAVRLCCIRLCCIRLCCLQKFCLRMFFLI